MAALVIQNGPQRHTFFPLGRRPHTTVGRGPNMDFQVTDPAVSRRHVLVNFDADTDRFLVSPLKSDGHLTVTLVNDIRLDSEVELNDQDLLVMGTTLIAFVGKEPLTGKNALQSPRNPREREIPTLPSQ